MNVPASSASLLGTTQLGVSVSAVRQAIDAGRLGAWLKAGRVFVDPRSLATFKLSPRGPKPRKTRRMARAKARKSSHVAAM